MTRVYFDNISGKDIKVTHVILMKRVIRKCIENKYPKHKFEVNLTVCNNEYIKELNKLHRDKDSVTDVLSFPFYDFDTPDVTTLLGDIVISLEKAEEQASLYGHSLKRELCFLAAHSAFHLLGYDHENEDEREEMEKMQRELLDSMGITR